MTSLSDLQGRVHDAILGVTTEHLKGLVADDRLGHAARLNVYRNNTTILLSEALGANFPTVAALVGDDFFSAMAKPFVRTHPPRDPCLFAYGADFAAYIEAFAPARELPYLADVARLDFALNAVHHAADAPHLDPQTLSAVASDDYPHLSFTAHPATRRVRSDHPIHAIWALHQDGSHAQTVDLAQGGEDVLVTYISGEARLSVLSHGAGALYQHLSMGAPLGACVARAQSEIPSFDAGLALSQLLVAGAFSAFEICPNK